jgi:hypothetical protein
MPELNNVRVVDIPIPVIVKMYLCPPHLHFETEDPLELL